MQEKCRTAVPKGKQGQDEVRRERTEMEKSLGGEDFISNAPEILEIIKRARRLTNKYNQSDYDARTIRRTILEELFGTVGQNVAVDTPFYCDYGKNIYIGNHVMININCTFVDCNRIEIGDKSLIGSNVQMYTATHPVQPDERLVENWTPGSGRPFFHITSQPIIIGQNVWIGGGAVILPGVTIGDNSVIGAGSVVNRSIPANSLAVGSPCRVIKTFDGRHAI